jgi:hypothetical protein
MAAVQRAGTWSGTLLLALACTACDGWFVRTQWDETPRQGLRVVASDVSDGVHAGRGAIRVEFDRPVDAASAGARSVRVERPGGRRVRRTRVWASGSSLFVAPPPGRPFPADVELSLRIEGGGSPRALRAEDGSTLGAVERLPFRILHRRRTDLEGPRLIVSEPAAGSVDAAPASHVQLVFDEPLARAPVRGGDAVAVYVNRRRTPARLRLSPDLTRLVVRPKRHLPPGAEVTVEVLPGLLDLSGNPAEAATVRFRTRATRLRELTEDFVTTDMQDAGGTTGGWAPPESPGLLVARAGRVRWNPADGDDRDVLLPGAGRVRFQVLFPGSLPHGGVVSALRVHLAGADEGELLPGPLVRVGSTSLVRVDPTFEANLAASHVVPAAESGDRVPVEVDENGDAFMDVAFDMPVPVAAGQALLADVELDLPLGVRVAAAEDSSGLALVENLGTGVLLPGVELLVSGGPPQARSAWWDSGVDRPGWGEAVVDGSDLPGDVSYVVEYQTAGANADGLPDLDRVSEWGTDLSQQPALRFVRFRVTFDRLGTRGEGPRIDRIVLPYQE